MKFLGADLVNISEAAAIAAPLLTFIAVSWFSNARSLERQLPLTQLKRWPGASGWWHALGDSLALWAITCGAAVVVLHNATIDVGARVGAYRTGIATVVLFALAAITATHRRIARKLPHGFVHDASHHKLQQNRPSHNFSHTLSISWSIKPKTWQRMHIALAIGAMLPLWWHCDFGRASAADLLLRSAAMLLLASGFLGTAMTDLSRWRLLSPRFSPRLSAQLIKGLLTVHRALALLTFVLITIHVLAVLYFAGI
jgi:hypothetical protein